jgi:hypothetical protein
VNTANGVLYGNQIPWGDIEPNQILWMLPPAEQATGNTIVLLTLGNQ